MRTALLIATLVAGVLGASPAPEPMNVEASVVTAGGGGPDDVVPIPR